MDRKTQVLTQLSVLFIRKSIIQYDDPTYVEPKAEDEDEVNEV